MRVEDTHVAAHRALAGGYRLLVLRSRQVAPLVQPGQFVHLKVPASAGATLRRPFSVFRAGPGRLSLLYKPVGKGTLAMTGLRPGDPVSLLGPLGNGYPAPRPDSIPVLVAGGYGMAALYLTARRAPRPGLVFVGGRSACDILCAPDFRRLGWEVRICTEDGSAGQRGLVTQALDRWLAAERRGQTPEFFACGPNGLLKVVCQRARRGRWPGWVSMDRHMGCGLGACLACVQRVRRREPGGRETWEWARICREGPVFACGDILWDGEEDD